MKRIIQQTPDNIVENGRIRFGMFDKPFRQMNFADADKWRGAGRLRLKEWLGYGIIHPDWYLTVFLLDAKLMQSGNFYAYNRKNGQDIRHARFRLDGRARIANNLYDDRCRYKSRGFLIEYHNHIDAGEHKIRVRIKGTRRNPGVDADITLGEDLSRVQPLVASIPLCRGGTAFTHKAAMPVSGTVRIGKQEITFDPSRDIALMDEHKSFLPWRLVWRWTTFAGYDAKGRLVALNLGDHDTVMDQEKWNENCLWVDGKMSLLGPVEFDLDAKRHMKPWKIREKNGRAEVAFHPQGDKIEKFNLGFMGMNYFQPCGVFKGFAVDDSGDKIKFEDFYGVAEVMDARF